MNFFLPVADDASQAEMLWRGSREMLRMKGFSTRERRIHSLYLERGTGEPRVLQVGVEEEESGEPVLLIFEAADAPFYWVCTISNGLAEGTPIPVSASKVKHEIPFDH
jgi:hypothetical protein